MTPKTCPSCHAPIPDNAPGGLCPACVLRDAEEPPAPGRHAPPLGEIAAAFPQWEILGLIGQGGMGFVYKVRQPGLDRVVAIKILCPDLSRDPAFAERFAREARTLGKLSHPNIVTVFEHGESGGFFYLLMEYVDGVNLRQAMRAGRFTPEQALAIVPGVCDALQAAHAQGIWHRDIKPENILLDREGKVKIADFGIARIVGDPQRDFTLTMTGGALGSAAYMAPEQHEKPHEVDHRADIYSLGVVIYEMLTGELPLGRFPAPSQRAQVNARIDEIVFRTLEKERDLRQQSAAEVRTEVEGADKAPATPPSKSAKASGSRKILIGCAALLIIGLLLLVISAGLLWSYRATQLKSGSQEEETNRIRFEFFHPELLSGGHAFVLPARESNHWFPRHGQPIALTDGRRVLVRARLIDVNSGGLDALASCSTDGTHWESLGVNLGPDEATKKVRFDSGVEVTVALLRSEPTPASGRWTVTRSLPDRSSPHTIDLPAEPKSTLLSHMEASGWMVHVKETPVLLIAGQGTTHSYSGSTGGGRIDGMIGFRDATLRVSMEEGNLALVNGSVYDLTRGRVLLVLPDGRLKQIDHPLDHLLDQDEIDGFVAGLAAFEVEEVLNRVLQAAREKNLKECRSFFSQSLLERVDADGDPGKNLGMLARLKFVRVRWVKGDTAKADFLLPQPDGVETEIDLDLVREEGLWKLAPGS